MNCLNKQRIIKQNDCLLPLVMQTSSSEVLNGYHTK